MRLIDADELKKDDEVTMWLSNDAIRTGKQLKMFSELFINKIDNAPTVQSVPIEDIKTDISKLQTYKCFEDTEKLVALDEVLQIIDKYRGKSEV